MVKKYVVEGRKWFDKMNGNTYHSVNVVDVDKNESVARVDFDYGYGVQWRDTAYNELIKLKLVKEADRFNHELNRKRFIYVNGEYVARKKDLKF